LSFTKTGKDMSRRIDIIWRDQWGTQSWIKPYRIGPKEPGFTVCM